MQDLGAPDVLAAASRIEQVVVNLLTNAAKATAPGKPAEVVVRVGPGAPGQARVEVIDRGAGIAAGHPQPDLRAVLHHAPGGEGKRDGLGLAPASRDRDLPRRNAHGGEHAQGHGSTFRLDLPAAPGEA